MFRDIPKNVLGNSGYMSEIKRRGRPKQFDREKTLEVAMQLYWKSGFEDMSINQVCQIAEVSKPSLYREFGGEEGLLTEIVQHYADTIMQPFKALFTEGRPFEEVLSSLIFAVENTSDQHQAPVGCLVMKLRSCKSKLRQGVQDSLDKCTADMLQAYTQWFAEQQDRLPSYISAETAAKYLDSQMSGAMVQLTRGETPGSVATNLKLALSVLGLPPKAS